MSQCAGRMKEVVEQGQWKFDSIPCKYCHVRGARWCAGFLPRSFVSGVVLFAVSLRVIGTLTLRLGRVRSFRPAVLIHPTSLPLRLAR